MCRRVVLIEGLPPTVQRSKGRDRSLPVYGYIRNRCIRTTGAMHLCHLARAFRAGAMHLCHLARASRAGAFGLSNSVWRTRAERLDRRNPTRRNPSDAIRPGVTRPAQSDPGQPDRRNPTRGNPIDAIRPGATRPAQPDRRNPIDAIRPGAIQPGAIRPGAFGLSHACWCTRAGITRLRCSRVSSARALMRLSWAFFWDLIDPTAV